MIMDILEESENPLILGQPFIKTAKMNIDMGKQKMWKRNGQKVVFHAFDKGKRNDTNKPQLSESVRSPGKKKDKITEG